MLQSTKVDNGSSKPGGERGGNSNLGIGDRVSGKGLPPPTGKGLPPPTPLPKYQISYSCKLLEMSDACWYIYVYVGISLGVHAQNS